MWRTRAVRRLLIENVAGIRVAEPDPEGRDEGRDEGPGDGSPSGASLSPLAAAEEALAKARRRAGLVVGVDLAAILILILFATGETSALTLGRSEGTVFTLAILAVAVHAGFRLGQLEKYGAVARASRDLAERDPEDGSAAPTS